MPLRRPHQTHLGVECTAEMIPYKLIANKPLAKQTPTQEF